MTLQDHRPEDSLIYQVKDFADDYKLSEFLTLSEFKSRDGYGLCLVHPALLTGFSLIRRAIDLPLQIQSGYRSDPHNARVGGSPSSYHRFGMAIDIRPVISDIRPEVTDDEMLEVLGRLRDLANAFGLGGVRLYRDEQFLHIDVGPKRIW